MRVARSIVTIDLGVESIWIGEVGVGPTGEFRKEPQLLHYAQVALPLGIWDKPDILADTLIEPLKQAVAQIGSTRNVYACIPRHLATVRPIQLPHAPEEELKGMVQFEAQQYVLYPVDEAVLSYCLLESRQVAADGAEVDVVLLAAVRRDIVEGVLAAFERAGVPLKNLTLSTAALVELGKTFPPETAFLFATPDSMDLVFPDTRAFFSRGVVLTGTKGDENMHAEKVAEEVIRSLAAYQNEYRGRAIAGLYLLGGPTSFLEVLRHHLQVSVEIPVEFYPWSARWPQHDATILNYARVLGMAFQATASPLLPLNFIPAARLERRQRLVKQRLGLVGIGVAGMAVFAITSVGLQAWQRHEQLQQQTLDINLKLQKFDKEKLKPLQDTVSKLSSVDQELQMGLDRQHPALDLLTALAQAMPSTPNIWLTQLSFTRQGTLTIRGNAKRSSDAVGLLLSLQRSRAFAQVQLSFLGDVSTGTGVNEQVSAANTTGSNASIKTNSGNMGPSVSAAQPPISSSSMGTSPVGVGAAQNGVSPNERRGAELTPVAEAGSPAFAGQQGAGASVVQGFQRRFDIPSSFTPGGPPPPRFAPVRERVAGGFPAAIGPMGAPGESSTGLPNKGGTGGVLPQLLRTTETASAPPKTLPSPLQVAPPNGGTLTSFVITLRVSPQAASLLAQMVADTAVHASFRGGTTAGVHR